MAVTGLLNTRLVLFAKERTENITETDYAELVTIMNLLKNNKYKNKPTLVDGIRFSSAKEAARYAVLKLLERGKVISDLQLQVSFELAPSVIVAGRKRPPLRYICDFTYFEAGKLVVEDVKGVLTDVYIIKRHLLKCVHNIDILET